MNSVGSTKIIIKAGWVDSREASCSLVRRYFIYLDCFLFDYYDSMGEVLIFGIGCGVIGRFYKIILLDQRRNSEFLPFCDNFRWVAHSSRFNFSSWLATI